MKKTFLLVPLAIILLMSLFLVSCEDEPEIKTYTVTFLLDEGDAEPFDKKTVIEGTGITDAKVPEKTGHKFHHWKTIEGNDAYELNTPVKGDLTLVAVWDINTYKVTFYNEDGTSIYSTTSANHGQQFSSVVQPTPEKTGHVLIGWSTEKGSTTAYDSSKAIEGNLKLYPIWEKGQYKISFICGEGAENVPQVQPVEFEGKATKPEKNPTRTGYEFSHWAAAENSENAYDFDTAITKDVVLYAVYDTLKISVSFYDEKGVLIPSSNEYEWGKDYDFPTITNKPDGFDYGWLLEGETSPKTGSSFNLPYSTKEYKFHVYITTDLLTIDKNGSVKATNTLKNSTDEISLSIPYSIEGIAVKAIGNNAFLNCSNLLKITIPETVTSMGTSVFANCRGLQSAVINANVNTLDENTFNSCDALKSISLSSTITEIKGVMLGNLQNLESITVSENNPYLKAEYGVLYSKDSTRLIHYPAKKEGEGYVIPSTVTIIEGQAFRFCRNLKSVTIPDNVTEIKVQAFSGCSNLTSIDIPNKVTIIGSYAFDGCTSLNSSITIPGTVTYIGQGAFLNCEKLESIVVDPGSITSLPDDLFKGCTSLTTIKVDQVNTAEYPSPIASNAPWGAPNVTKDQVQWKIVE
ncbi:MAG: leucine-rich repeat protein [Spirochaetales bacterium]|nr:leucine-rich repeat protein [Spirochaetales bacterium]